MKRPKRKILLIGGGGHCRSVLSSLLTAGETVVGIVDKEEKAGEKIFGVPVIGTDRDLPALRDKGYEVIITVGSTKDNSRRAELYDMAKELGFKAASFIARSAIIGKDVSIGEGTVVLEGAIINAGARTGGNCIINTGAVIEHDVMVGDNVHIASGSVIGGEVRVGGMAFIGTGTKIIQGIEIGSKATVGAGSVVIEDVPEGVLVAGCPAKIIR